MTTDALRYCDTFINAGGVFRCCFMEGALGLELLDPVVFGQEVTCTHCGARLRLMAPTRRGFKQPTWALVFEREDGSAPF